MTTDDLQARIGRLDELARGLMKEKAIIRKGRDPLLHLERRAYLCAIADALFGVEAARVVLAQALQRIREEGRAKKKAG